MQIIYVPYKAGLILGLRSASERRRSFDVYNQPYKSLRVYRDRMIQTLLIPTHFYKCVIMQWLAQGIE